MSRDKPWYFMRTLWVIEKFVRLLKDMLSTGAGDSMTVVSCAVGVTDAPSSLQL